MQKMPLNFDEGIYYGGTGITASNLVDLLKLNEAKVAVELENKNKLYKKPLTIEEEKKDIA